jgi:cellulose synthase/poly-beta-1,6-N-acetylglucosamine synthase-like glycosyltransferase
MLEEKGRLKPMEKRRLSLAYYTLFIVPLSLAFLSWALFPSFAELIAIMLFKYKIEHLQPNPIWAFIVNTLYTWYTFVFIGLSGILIVTAWISTKKAEKELQKDNRYPSISFIIPAYNEEENIRQCITSVFKSASNYFGLSEIIVVDDGSTDYTYEIAWATLETNRKKYPNIRGKIVRHSANLGKIEAIRTGTNKALSELIAIIDADSTWKPETLEMLISYMNSEAKSAVTGYVHPKNGNSPCVILQQLEYSQGLGIFRCAQSLSKSVLVVSGAIGLYHAETLRDVLNQRKICSVTEDLEITLELHKRGLKVGYVNAAQSSTLAPTLLSDLWRQRLRWFIGWVHNALDIHQDMLFNRKTSVSLLLLYSLIFEYGGAFVDLVALCIFPFIFWFAPDRILFLLNLLLFTLYMLTVSFIIQLSAFSFAYKRFSKKYLLMYLPFYPLLRFVNICARIVSVVRYVFGDKGNWHP